MFVLFSWNSTESYYSLTFCPLRSLLIIALLRLFTRYAYSKQKSHTAKHFLVTSYTDYSSMVVTEDRLEEMRDNEKVDDACLIYIVKQVEENV